MGNYRADAPDPGLNVQQLFAGLERFLLPVDQLSGGMSLKLPGLPATVIPGPRYAGFPTEGTRADRLLGSIFQSTLDMTNRFAPQFQDLQANLLKGQLERDPLAKGLYDLSLQGIAGQKDVLGRVGSIVSGDLASIEAGQIPESLRRNMLESIRASGSSRGLLESPVAALQEVSSEAGLFEAVRQNRLANASAFLSGAAGAAAPGLGFVQPQAPIISPTGVLNPTQVMGSLPGLIAAQQSNQQFNAGMGLQSDLALGQGLGALFGMGAGAFGGGLGLIPGLSGGAAGAFGGAFGFY